MARRKRRREAGDANALPGYQDLVEVGGGAFAAVYRATETDTGRPVAMKVLRVDTSHTRAVEAFAGEIQALGRVSTHPHIVTLYRSLAMPDGRPVLIMELCRESLAQRVRREGPISAREVTAIGIKIAGALETVHLNGYLHRDMKPQNILVTQFGEPALADFGVATLKASAQETAGVVGFTTLHAAPEILEGHELSAATDVYGLASTMYQLLTGKAPFHAFENEAPASVILRILRDPVAPLRSASIPIALSDILEAAMAKSPGSRPATAASLAQALRDLEATRGWEPTPCIAWASAQPAPGAPPATEENTKARAKTPTISFQEAVTPGPPRPAEPAPPRRPGPKPPARPAPPGPVATRPEFVYPDPATREAGTPTRPSESVYEATMLPTAVRSRTPETSTTDPARKRRRSGLSAFLRWPRQAG